MVHPTPGLFDLPSSFSQPFLLLGFPVFCLVGTGYVSEADLWIDPDAEAFFRSCAEPYLGSIVLSELNCRSLVHLRQR